MSVECDDGRTWAALLREWHEFLPHDDEGIYHADFVSAPFVEHSGIQASELLIKVNP